MEKQGKNARVSIVQTVLSLFLGRDGAPVARAFGSTARTPRARAEKGLNSKPRDPYLYSPKELVTIAIAVREEKRRGAVPRFWDDVEIGAPLDPLVKGPLTITDMICWYSGAGHTYKAHARAQRHRDRHPADAFVNPKTGAQDSAARGHAEQAMAREVGMPGGYDVGPQRISWAGQLVTNWIGDDGFMRMLDVKLRRPNIFGDTSWCRGQVTGKRIEDRALLVDLDIRIESQLGEITAEGCPIRWRVSATGQYEALRRRDRCH